MATLVRRHPFLAYYILTFALSWGGFVLVVGPVSLVNANWQAEGKLLVRGRRHAGGPEYRGLAADRPGRWTRWISRPVAATPHMARRHRWYALAILPAPIVSAGILFMLSIPSPLLSADDRAAVLLGGFGAAVTTIFEEIGWTGFAVPMISASSQRPDDRPHRRRAVGTVAPPAAGLRQRYVCRRNSAARVSGALGLCRLSRT